MEKFISADILSLMIAEFNEEVLKEHIRKGDIDVNAVTMDGSTTLHRSIYLNNLEVAKYLINLKEGDEYLVDINKKDESGMTPLALASFCDREEIAKMLLARDDVVVIGEEDIKDPLGIACMENNENIVKVILESGKVDLKKRKLGVKEESTLLHCAYAKDNVSLMKELIKHGVDVNDKDKEGYTVAHYVVSQQNSKRRTKFLEILFGGSKDCINEVDSNGDTLLHYACKLGYIDVVKFLVSKKNLKINAQDANGFSALHFVCLQGRTDMVKVLLDRADINVNIKENKGLTPLHVAANRENNELIEMLLQKGADVNSLDEMNLTPVNYACFTHNIDTMRLLLRSENIKLDKNRAIDLNMVFDMCILGYKDVLEILLDKMDVDLGIDNGNGNNLLWLACDAGWVDIVNMLLNRNDVKTEHKNYRNHKGVSPLHRACCKRHAKVVQVLLQQDDIDINLKDNEGWTPLHYMTYANYTDIVELLLKDPRIRVNEADDNGYTPIRFACDRNDSDLVNILFEKGGDLTIRDKFGLSPIHVVFTRDNEEMKSTIKKAIYKELLRICRADDVAKVDNLLNICQVIHLSMEKECLRLACSEGSEVIIEHLLKKGVNVNQRYDAKETLMYYACLNDNTDIACTLMKYNIDISDRLLERYVNDNKSLDISKLILKYATLKFINECKEKRVKEAVKLLKYDLSVKILALGNRSILEVANGDMNISEALGKHLARRLPVALENNAIGDVLLMMKLGVDINGTDRNGKNVLMHAIDSKYFLFAKKLIDDGIDINVCDSSGMNALMYASRKGSIHLVNLLIEKGIQINAVDKKGKNALMYALESRANQVACVLAKFGIDVMAEDIEGKSALMYALENRVYGITRSFLEEGVRTYTDKNGRTLLMYAAKGAQMEVVDYILRIGFNINYVNDNKESALLWAIEGKNRDAIEYLLRKGAKVSVLDRKEKKALKELTKLDNRTSMMIAVQEYDINKLEQYPKLIKMALIYAITYGYDPVAKYIVNGDNVNMIYNQQTLLTYTINSGNEVMVNYLIKNGASVNAKSKNKITALMTASCLGYAKTVKRLVESGADAELMDNNGMTTIWYAFLGIRDKETIDYLLNCGVRMYGVDNNDMNMLMYASKYGLEYTLDDLLSRGFKVNYSNRERKTALLYALESGHDRIVRKLIKNNANIGVIKNNINAIFRMSEILRKDFSIEEVEKRIDGRSTMLFDSISKKNMLMLKELVDESMNDVDERGKTTLMYLCENGIEAAKLFIDNDIGINDVDNKGNTPLMYAMKGGNNNLIRALICEGSDLDAANNEGKTVLMYAVELNQDTVLQYRSMNVDICDNKGYTALMYAVKLGNKDVVDELLLRCADANVVNKDGKTALMMAIEAGKQKIAKLLINYSLTEINVKNEIGETAMTYAARSKSAAIVKELLAKGAVIPEDKETIVYIKSLMKNDYKIQELVRNNRLPRDRKVYVPAVEEEKRCDRVL